MRQVLVFWEGSLALEWHLRGLGELVLQLCLLKYIHEKKVKHCAPFPVCAPCKVPSGLLAPSPKQRFAKCCGR